ncbi:hypothetical protein GUJ93_ZPchr0458g22695 [Zizania palustris]|uniref:Late embryogenesis abundant protein LEA-2 subgroup domain-containing protein n=1 Tax=Zizania palustris TaxID=103762 RepID=A0A8J5V2W0_ZIZPA|nr:hypothetical protein GUJ93_ZPchr0458g22695 [Zizania palustris]
MFQQLASVRNPNRAPLAHYDSSLCVAYSGWEVDSIYIPVEQIDGGRTQYMATSFTVPIFVVLLCGADHHRLRPLPGSGHRTSASSPAVGSTAAVGGGLSSDGEMEGDHPPGVHPQRRGIQGTRLTFCGTQITRFPANFRVEETERSNATSELSLLGSRSVQVIQMELEHSHSSEPKIDGVTTLLLMHNPWQNLNNMNSLKIQLQGS